jgi:large subunit ribosomal protein L9
MKVILLQNVPNLGQAGDVVEVKAGYGRNYLLPRGMAQGLTKKALAEIEEIKRVAIARADRELGIARDMARKLEGHVIRMEGRTGARGAKLYGSVTTQSLAVAIGAFLEAEIDKRKISVPEPIKTLGLHSYIIRLHSEVEVEGKVEVVKMAEEA